MAEGEKLQGVLSFKEHHSLLTTGLKELHCKQYSKARTPVVPVPAWVFKYSLIFQGHKYYAHTHILSSEHEVVACLRLLTFFHPEQAFSVSLNFCHGFS